MLKSCVLGCFAEEAAELAGEAVAEGDLTPDDIDGGNPENIANKESLNAAADHLEEPGKKFDFRKEKCDTKGWVALWRK